LIIMDDEGSRIEGEGKTGMTSGANLEYTQEEVRKELKKKLKENPHLRKEAEEHGGLKNIRKEIKKEEKQGDVNG